MFDWHVLIQESCAVDSRTIDGAAGATQVAQLYAPMLEPLGFKLTWHDVDPCESPRGRHLQAVRCPQKTTDGILLLGHTDTVRAPVMVPWQHSANTPKIQGSGVCDMKGGCVLMLHAIATALNQSQSNPAAEQTQATSPTCCLSSTAWAFSAAASIKKTNRLTSPHSNQDQTPSQNS